MWGIVPRSATCYNYCPSRSFHLEHRKREGSSCSSWIPNWPEVEQWEAHFWICSGGQLCATVRWMQVVFQGRRVAAFETGRRPLHWCPDTRLFQFKFSCRKVVLTVYLNCDPKWRKERRLGKLLLPYLPLRQFVTTYGKFISSSIKG